LSPKDADARREADAQSRLGSTTGTPNCVSLEVPWRPPAPVGAEAPLRSGASRMPLTRKRPRSSRSRNQRAGLTYDFIPLPSGVAVHSSVGGNWPGISSLMQEAAFRLLNVARSAISHVADVEPRPVECRLGADEGAFVIDSWTADFWTEPTPERPADDARARRVVAVLRHTGCHPHAAPTAAPHNDKLTAEYGYPKYESHICKPPHRIGLISGTYKNGTGPCFALPGCVR
jgi:hypothetical protein